MIEEILSNPDRVTGAMESLQYSTIEASVPYVLCHFLQKRREIYKTNGVYVLHSPSRAWLVPVEPIQVREFVSLIASLAKKHKVIMEIPFPYRRVLSKMGYQVQEDTIATQSFLFSTAHLLSVLSEGRKYREIRRLNRRFLESGGYYRILTKSDIPQIIEVEDAWARDKKDAHESFIMRKHDPSTVMQNLSSIHSGWGLNMVGAYNSGDQLQAFALGCKLTTTHWACLYSYGLRSCPSLMNLSWLKLAELYADTPFENDGNGHGGGLYANKLHFVSEDVKDSQIFLGSVRVGR